MQPSGEHAHAAHPGSQLPSTSRLVAGLLRKFDTAPEAAGAAQGPHAKRPRLDAGPPAAPAAGQPAANGELATRRPREHSAPRYPAPEPCDGDRTSLSASRIVYGLAHGVGALRGRVGTGVPATAFFGAARRGAQQGGCGAEGADGAGLGAAPDAEQAASGGSRQAAAGDPLSGAQAGAGGGAGLPAGAAGPGSAGGWGAAGAPRAPQEQQRRGAAGAGPAAGHAAPERSAMQLLATAAAAEGEGGSAGGPPQASQAVSAPHEPLLEGARAAAEPANAAPAGGGTLAERPRRTRAVPGAAALLAGRLPRRSRAKAPGGRGAGARAAAARPALPPAQLPPASNPVWPARQPRGAAPASAAAPAGLATGAVLPATAGACLGALMAHALPLAVGTPVLQALSSSPAAGLPGHAPAAAQHPGAAGAAGAASGAGERPASQIAAALRELMRTAELAAAMAAAAQAGLVADDGAPAVHVLPPNDARVAEVSARWGRQTRNVPWAGLVRGGCR